VIALLLAAPAAAPAQTEQAAPKIPWQARLGLRSRQVDQAFPLVDRVVLVPDEATYVDELSRWSPRGRWPVLFDDDVYAAMFIRRFAPAEILVRAPLEKRIEDLPATIDDVIVTAWGAAPGTPVRDAFERHEFRPPGVVIAAANDPAWTAAVALAAGRGQPVGWLDPEVDRGRTGQILEQPRTLALRSAVDEIVAGSGYAWPALGDDIDAITLCFRMAALGQVVLSPDQSPEVEPARYGPPYAMTDLIGRRSDGERYVWHGYPAGASWDRFDPTPAETALRGAGFTTDLVKGDPAGVIGWRRRLAGGWSTDLLLVNSKGHTNDFDLYTGTGYPADVPILNEPIAVHFVHSWSMRNPGRRATVAGRWLERGAYAYIGSSQEPYLPAFVPPVGLAERVVNNVPLLLAGRHYPPYPLSKPWRINTFGDPLMLVLPPEQQVKERSAIAGSPAPAETVNLMDRVKTLLRACAGNDHDAPYGEAMRVLGQLGRDDLAQQLWGLAKKHGRTRDVAPFALQPLFRARDVGGFVEAWSALPEDLRSDRGRDMLWHLMDTRLAAIDDEATISILQAAIRRPQAHVDLERLAPALARVYGRPQVKALIRRELQTVKNAGERKALEKLAERY
jgi:hypothetical protein